MKNPSPEAPPCIRDMVVTPAHVYISIGGLASEDKVYARPMGEQKKLFKSVSGLLVEGKIREEMSDLLHLGLEDQLWELPFEEMHEKFSRNRSDVSEMRWGVRYTRSESGAAGSVAYLKRQPFSHGVHSRRGAFMSKFGVSRFRFYISEFESRLMLEHKLITSENM